MDAGRGFGFLELQPLTGCAKENVRIFVLAEAPDGLHLGGKVSFEDVHGSCDNQIRIVRTIDSGGNGKKIEKPSSASLDHREATSSHKRPREVKTTDAPHGSRGRSSNSTFIPKPNQDAPQEEWDRSWERGRRSDSLERKRRRSNSRERRRRSNSRERRRRSHSRERTRQPNSSAKTA